MPVNDPVPPPSIPETLVLYRTRPIDSGQVGSGSCVGRVRYSCLKEAAVGKHLCKLNGVGVMRKASGTSRGARKKRA